MGIKSGISWTDHTWNIARGCSKVDADCLFCYMYREGERFKYDAKKVVRTKSVFKLPLTIKEPSMIFTSSLTDFFHEDIDSYRDEAWNIIRKCPQHTFQILTKRPERIGQLVESDLKNVWLGCSAGSSATYNRLYDFYTVKWPNTRKFLSLEPLHGKIDLFERMFYKKEVLEMHKDREQPFAWVIVGGESGNETGKYRYRECQIEWIELIVSQCKAAGVPVFVKQLGTHLAKELGLKDRHGADISEWPEHLRVQEFPVGMKKS